MLTFAFAETVIARMTLMPVRRLLEKAIADNLTVGELVEDQVRPKPSPRTPRHKALRRSGPAMDGASNPTSRPCGGTFRRWTRPFTASHWSISTTQRLPNDRAK
jgi:hypothetical protein